MALRRGETAKLAPDQEEALLNSLRIQRELVAHTKLQGEAFKVANKLLGVDISKVADEAAVLANKDRTNFGLEQSSAVCAITTNAVLLSACAPAEEAGADKKKEKGGKGGYGGAADKKKDAKGGGNKKQVKAVIGTKTEKLPPPTCDAAKAAIIANKDTLAKVSSFKDGQLALLRAFESWLLLEHHEPLLVDAPKLLEAFAEAGLIDNEIFRKYWGNVQTTRVSDGAELVVAKTKREEAETEHADAVEKLKAAQKELDDALQRVKWAAIEAQNARCGNQPSAEEVAREKAATAANNKALAQKLQQTKVFEMCHKRQVTSLNTKEAADRGLVDKTNQMKPLETIHQYAGSFFEALPAPAA